MQRKTLRLDNGLPVVAIQRPARTALLSVELAVGSACESTADNGLSHFLEHMIFQGCATHPTPDEVNRAAERMGAALDAMTGRESTRIEHWIDPTRLADSASLVAELLRTPRFEGIETERQIIIEEALDEVDEDGRLVDADSLSRRALWPEGGFGQRVIGEEDNLRRFSVDDLARFHGAHYHAGNMVVAVVSPDPPEVALETVAKAFGTLPAPAPSPPPSPGEMLSGPAVVTVTDGRSQCDFRLVFRTGGRSGPDAIALAMLRATLDDGLSTRLQRRLGGELGLAYHQWAVWEPYRTTGAFELGAQVSAGKLEVLMEEMQGLLTGLIDDPPRGDELDFVRFRIDWSLRCLQESAEGLAAQYAGPLLFGEPVYELETLRELVAAITPEQLSDVAARTFDPKHSVSCVVGDMDKPTRRAVKHLSRRFRA